MNPDIHYGLAKLLPLSFFVYAWLQPLYLFRLTPGFHIEWVFIVALGAKILISISALSVMQRDFAALQERLKERSVLEDLGRLTASIEHDIKNPLLVVDNLIDEMKERFQANPDVLPFLRRIEAQNQRIYATTQVVPIFRREKGFYAKVSLGYAISQSVKAVKQEMNCDGIHFRQEDRVVYGYASLPMLQRAIVNVLKNAVEAIRETKRENGLVQIDLKELRDSENMSVIEITDNGCGIPAEDTPKLEKLENLFSTKREKKPNSGIGLFITERIMTFHGGKLQITSEGPSRGATVSLYLPRWQEPK